MRARHEQLKAAPLVEAVFELRATGSRPFSLIPGAVAAALRNAYPHAESTQAEKIAGLFEVPSEVGLIITHKFFSPDRKKLIQVGPGGVSVNSLNYTGFEAFRESVAELARIYFDVAQVEKVSRLGLRYINGIRSSKPALGVRVEWPSMGHVRLSSEALRGVFEVNEPPGKLAVAVSLPHPTLGTLLDLDFFAEPNTAMSHDSLLTWTDGAHDRAYEAFRAMVPEPLYETWRKPQEVKG
jgi:uncharacterized protein (TIGR04255 family)